MTDEERCECGQPLATHTPLPKPPPLRSWHSQRRSDGDKFASARRSVKPPEPRNAA